jgi:hypothetical protein
VQVMIRFENVHTEQIREVGPFEFAQLTYADLRVGPDGDEYASNRAGEWVIDSDQSVWSDIIIHAADQEDDTTVRATLSAALSAANAAYGACNKSPEHHGYLSDLQQIIGELQRMAKLA